ncbi:apurinic endonuclease [Yasminevirus sp. GU-2018]|uniref:Apurinic endonuclease n=1 Tax=Yasminevirus sp. GU-2018 TaxID=2420051 RepID=A0A5K0UAD8_9VIRU|nr:apurinic endonuclease [Yasminevirus sp. GU-2018]
MELGHNILTHHGYSSAADRAVETGADVYQIFYRSPQSYNSFKRPEEETKLLAEKNKKYKKKMVIHGSYLINLCQDPSDYRHYKGVNILVEDLDVSVELNAIGVIIHMGNDTEKNGDVVSKQNYITGIKEALKRSNNKSTLILETGAGTGNEMSSSLEELGAIRRALSPSEQKRVKFCLDTCHMFAYGYRLDLPDLVNYLDWEIEEYLGWDNIAVVHLNDSEDKCKSRKDNHADIGKGCIRFEGLMRFVHLCVKHKIPMVLETPTHFYNDERFTAEKQMNLIRTYYNIMYNSLGPQVKVTERTLKKKDLRTKIQQSKSKTVSKKVGKSKCSDDDFCDGENHENTDTDVIETQSDIEDVEEDTKIAKSSTKKKTNKSVVNSKTMKVVKSTKNNKN